MKPIFKKQIPKILRQGLILSFLPLVLAISGCTKTYDCDKINLILSFQAKTIDSLRDFTIYKFQKGTNYSVLLDSLKILNGTGVYFESITNHTRVFFQAVDYRVVGEFDWNIRLYSTTVSNGLNEISISNIVEQNETMKCKKKDFATAANGCQCMNTLKSYNLNGAVGNVGNKIEYNGFVGYELIIAP